MENPGPQGELLYTEVFSDNPSVWEDASPVAHVAAGKGIPPFLLIYASQTGQRREAQNYRFSEVLKASGIQVVVTEVSNQDHSSINQTFGSSNNEATQSVETSLDYLF